MFILRQLLFPPCIEYKFLFNCLACIRTKAKATNTHFDDLSCSPNNYGSLKPKSIIEFRLMIVLPGWMLGILIQKIKKEKIKNELDTITQISVHEHTILKT